jgi:AcrR family transcriptional regulator
VKLVSEKKESLTELQKKEILRMNNKESNQLTRECLQLALIHLMAEQPYEKITVSEIVRRAGVSRTAFYRNYTDKEDILHEMGGKLIEMISELTDKPELFEDSRNWFENVFRLMRENKDVLTLLDKAGIQQEYLFSGRSIVETLYPAKDTEDKYLKLAAEAAFYQILITWFRDGMQEEESYMADICIEIFDNILKKLDHT